MPWGAFWGCLSGISSAHWANTEHPPSPTEISELRNGMWPPGDFQAVQKQHRPKEPPRIHGFLRILAGSYSCLHADSCGFVRIHAASRIPSCGIVRIHACPHAKSCGFMHSYMANHADSCGFMHSYMPNHADSCI